MSSQQLSQAAKHMEEAKKKGTKGIFNWSPSFDDAADLYGKAAAIYRNNNSIEEARKAYELQAEMFEKGDLLGLSAKALENAGQMMADAGKILVAAPLLERAAKTYARDNKMQLAANIMQKAARAMLDTEDPSLAQKAVEMCLNAITALENDDKHILTKDLYRMAVLCLLRGDKKQDAIALLKKQIPSLVKSTNQDAVAKNSLEIVILCLAMGDGVLANRYLQELSTTAEGFSSSEEYFKAVELCSAFDDRDQDRLSEVGKSQLLSFLIPEISRMAKRLKVDAGMAKPKQVAPAAGAAPPQAAGGSDVRAQLPTQPQNDDDDEDVR